MQIRFSGLFLTLPALTFCDYTFLYLMSVYRNCDYQSVFLHLLKYGQALLCFFELYNLGQK